MIEVKQCDPTPDVVETYAGISTVFDVTSRADPKALYKGTVIELPVEMTARKDASDEDARDWPRLYDLAGWALFLATDAGIVTGACAVEKGSSSLYINIRPDETILWDVRVSQEHRGRGVGRALIAAAASWARDQGCEALYIETQDTNVNACRLYLSAGAKVHSLRPGAYEEYAEEVLVVFRLPLT